MASVSKSLNRERKIQKRNTGMKIGSKSVFQIQEEQKKRSEEIKRRREEKASLQELSE
jgi:hypothetical protein